MRSHLSEKIDPHKEPLAGQLGVLAFSSVNTADIWQACWKLLPSNGSLLSCELLNAEWIGTWRAVLFPIPCEFNMKEDKNSAHDKQQAERLQL